MTKQRQDDLRPEDRERLTPGEFIERAREQHARTGEWPPDPLLDEVAEMRRRVLAEHGNDYQKMLDWYVHRGKQHAAQNGNGAKAASRRMEEG